MSCSSVVEALKQTKKGQLVYDNHWKEEGRTEEIVNSIEQSLSILKLPQISTSKILSYSDDVGDNAQRKNDSKSNNPDDACVLDQLLEQLKQENEQNNRLNYSNRLLLTDKILQIYEQQRVMELEQRTNEKLKTFIKKSGMSQYEDQIPMLKKKHMLDWVRHRKKYEEEEQQLLQELENLKQQMAESHLKKENIKQIQIKKIEERQKLEEAQIKLKEMITCCKNQASAIISDIENILKESISELSTNYLEELLNFKNKALMLEQDIEEILLSKTEYTNEDVDSSNKILNEIISIKEKISAKLIQIKQNQSASINSSSLVTQNVQQPVDSPKSKSTKKPTETKSPRDIYLEYSDKMQQFTESYEKFSKLESNKQRRQIIQIYIGSIINTISNISVEALREKLQLLLQLFNNKQFYYQRKLHQIDENDYSYHFAIHIAVKLIINVATHQRNMSLKIAPVIIILWANVRMFGEVFFSHLCQWCPYIIPYFPTITDVTNEDELKLLKGYKSDSESDEAFQTRISSLIELYSSTIQCNITDGTHPHDLNHAWRWLACVLNSQPEESITAIVLDSFLTNSSHKLYSTYGRQFIKMIHFIKHNYLKQIESITSVDGRPSFMKFNSYIEKLYDILQRKHVSKETIIKSLAPNGLVPNYFFTNSYIFQSK